MWLPIVLITASALYYFTRPPPNSFTMYWATWCPHCNSVLPSFLKLSSKNNGISCRTVESKLNYEMKVEGYPTFVYTDKNGVSEIFRGSRTIEAWTEYLNSK